MKAFVPIGLFLALLVAQAHAASVAKLEFQTFAECKGKRIALVQRKLARICFIRVGMYPTFFGGGYNKLVRCWLGIAALLPGNGGKGPIAALVAAAAVAAGLARRRRRG